MVIWSANAGDANKKNRANAERSLHSSRLREAAGYWAAFRRKYTGTPISTITSPGTVVEVR